jgi:DNA gyrase B subunit
VTKTYTESDIKVLEGLEAVRKRPGMYIGSTGPRGLHHLVYEIVDNAVDEALAGFCTRIEVSLDRGEVVTVRDNGRGIPTGIHPVAGIPTPELIFTRLHAGGKFDNASYKVSGGLHGVGSSVVNALSSFFEYEILRDNRRVFGRFENGGHVAVPMEDRGGTRGRGTTVRFLPDADIFESVHFNHRTLRDRLQELAFLNPGLTIEFTDRRSAEVQQDVWNYAHGLRDYLDYLQEGKVCIGPVVHFTDEVEGITVELAFQYNDGYSESLLSFANCINTVEGGQHETGFRTAHTRVFNDYARRMNLWKKKDNLAGEDLREGLAAILHVRLREPEFEGQTKTKLGNSEVRAAVDAAVSKRVSAFLEENPHAAKELFEKAQRAHAAREAARKARDLTRTGGTASSQRSSLGGKLTRCSSRVPAECELFIVEGDSAGGSAKQGRDRRTQAILPLRGKPLNTERAQLDKLLKNKEILSIVQAVGAGVGTDFKSSESNYGRVIVMADADDDGAHIRCLLLTFFYRYMRPLVVDGRVFLAQPPLFRVERKSSGKRKRSNQPDVVYCWSTEEMQKAVAKMGSQTVVQRYKGLGEMNPEQLWETTLDPARRTLLQVSVEDAAAAAAADRQLTTLMGDSPESRRQWIARNVKFGELRDDEAAALAGIRKTKPATRSV